MLKKVLDIMGLSYQEGNLIAKGYGKATKNVEILIPQHELRKVKAGTYGDMGFMYNKETETYDVVVDDYDRRLVDTFIQLYAVETIKNFATSNRKEYQVVSGMEKINSHKEIILDVYV